jgi:3-oxoacyl-[acyl-carrier protein] reductase
MDLSNKRVALVTGGAAGIGHAISSQLAKQGYVVLVHYHSSATQAQSLVQSIQTQGGQALSLQADLTNLVQVEAMMKRIQDEVGQLDILVNNAGITQDALLLRMDEKQFDQVIATNLKAVWLLSKLSLKFILKSSQGRIINISSFSGLYGLPGQTNYAAAKAGVIGFTKSLAHEIASRQVTVNAVAPGYIETNMTEKLDPLVKEQVLKMIPLKRYGSPQDVAHLVAFLASVEAGYITGQTLSVDGGMYM